MNNKDLLKAIGDIDEKYLIEETDIEELHAQGFTVREIEKLKGESKSTVSRKLSKGEEINE